MTSLHEFDELLHESGCTPERICAHIARLFNVRLSEIGLLNRSGDHLSFLFPPELRVAGTIPLTTSAVAARTAVTRQPEIFNRFVTVPHHSVFETVKVEDPGQSSESPTIIQKLMSAPLTGDDGEIVGVLQVCRKGTDPASAGPDFTPEDLETLARIALRVALLMPELVSARQTRRHALRFQSTGTRKTLIRGSH